VLSRHWEFDTAPYFVPSYTRFDVRLDWHPAITGAGLGLQNWHAKHPEFRSTDFIVVPSQAPRRI
jgi:hypothetical protein